MRRPIVISLCLAVMSTACSGAAEPNETAEDTAEIPTDVPTTARTSTPRTIPEGTTHPVWKGFAATDTSPPTLAAMVHGPVDVYETPGEAEPEMTLDATTILGTITVLGVVTNPEDGWAEVMLPIRPNGSTGWVNADDVSFYVADSEIVIDLSERRLSYVVGGVEVLDTEVGIGSEYNRTPTGRYFVTDSVTLSDPASPWGPHALGISARSETITEFNGGDGIIGIHGTNNPGSVGGNISLGCVRLPNDMITALYEMVPIGTPVSVRA